MPGQGQTQAFLGVVRGLASGQPIGPASTMSYDVLVNFPHGGEIVRGIRPAEHRWPDEINCRAIAANTAIWVASERGQLQLMGREIPNAVACPGSSGVTGGSTLLQQVRNMTPAEKAELRELLK